MLRISFSELKCFLNSNGVRLFPVSNIKEKLSQVSSCFCAAKWLQVTVHLQKGHTHSCHHPITHKVPLEELAINPSALHNTEQKKLARKMMLEGQRPPECSYCWKVEDLPGSQVSDRYIKSSDSWAQPYLDRIAQLPWDADVNPTYLEVSFSSVCNFKCAYCYPDVSSKWMSEVMQYGPYPTSDYHGSLVYLQNGEPQNFVEKDNPYIKAFWEWLPKIINELEVLRVTGGEPLLSKDCLRLIDYLNENPNPKLVFSVNSNLGVPTRLVSNVVEKLRNLKATGKAKDVSIYTSLDTWGPQSAYIRYGLDLELWKTNLELVLKNSDVIKTTVMVTFNILSVFNFKQFLSFILDKKKQYNNKITADISILHNPAFLSLQFLPERHMHYIEEAYDFMLQNPAGYEKVGFSRYEISKMKRLVEFAKSKLSEYELNERQENFAKYFKEYDRRKGTSFTEIFPEMALEFEQWKKKANKKPIFKKIKFEMSRHYQKIAGRKLMEVK